VSRGLQLCVHVLRLRPLLTCEGARRAGQDSRIRPGATISIAKITMSDRNPVSIGHLSTETSHLVVDLSPLVMAIWSL
jgi:hypothetical protein